jgi:hypothetical protein
VATDFGRVLAGGEVWYPYADFLPMVYLYQSRWGRFVPKAVLSAGRASGLFLDRGWALVDVTGLRTGTFPVLFELG